MIDFILENGTKDYKNRVNEITRDLNRILGLEKFTAESSGERTGIRGDLLDRLSPDERAGVIKLYQEIYSSNTLRKHTVINKYLPGKRGRHKKGPTFADFFSGAGGLGLGLENAGLCPTFVSDHNYSALQTYYLNHNVSKKNFFLGGMQDILKNLCDYQSILKDTFLIAGGPPCQGFSTANRQPMLNDPRNELYKDLLLIIEEIRPPFFLLENVRGMVKKREEIETDLNHILGNEYHYTFLVLNAKNYNIPQNRERLFIIGNKLNINPEDIAYSVMLQGKGTQFTLRHALEGLPEIQASTEFNQPFLENDQIGYKIYKQEPFQSEYSDFVNNGKSHSYTFNHKSRYNNENDREIFKRLPPGGNSLHEDIQDIIKYKNRENIFKDKYYRLEPNKVSKAITSHMRFDCHMYIHPSQARGLSPREAARIQTFPDNYIFMGRPNEWYQQIGNAVPVKLAEVLGKEIIKYWK